nr:hypothetical protein [Psychrobacter sp. PraFG1]UNK05616.1 hypothetical protein MN210_01650 [Psychrobacter sp. PraFG1]
MSIKEKLFSKTPYFIQNSAIALFNNYQYKMRHGGVYNAFRDYYARAELMNEFELHREIDAKKMNSLIMLKLNLLGTKIITLMSFSHYQF